MKISISYPPFESDMGIALLSQNRQFQWFKEPTYIYPVVPGYAATLLKQDGHDVIWDDGIAEEKSFSSWYNDIISTLPDMIVFESKTPVIKKHWKIINQLKKDIPECKIVLLGDHVTALPEESFLNSKVDYVITGGNYDFGLRSLIRHLHNEKEPLDSGIWWSKDNQLLNSGKTLSLHHDLNELPYLDRDLTQWRLYSEKNGNFKYLPGTYMMVGRDCWWGRCTFCSWTTLHPHGTFKVQTPEKALDEVEHLVYNYGIKEIFDDSGCFPAGHWLRKFCQGMVDRSLHKKVVMGCNMRFDALKEDHYKLLGKANFRFILFGVESANQQTIERLDKKITISGIEQELRWCKKFGLEPHITTMMGYPWETRQDAQNSINFVKSLFKKGLIDTMQATITVPYPGTPLFDECKKNGWLKSMDWDVYDMKGSAMINPLSDEDVMRLTQQLYTSFMSPQFILRKVFSIRSIEDLSFLFRAGKKLIGHVLDFKPNQMKQKEC